MTLRGRILTEICCRLVAAFPDAVIEVGEDVSIRAPAGALILVIVPGSESPWDAETYDPVLYREWFVGVQMSRARDAADVTDSLAAWINLEDEWPPVAAAVEGWVDAGHAPNDNLGGLVASMDRMTVDPSEQPVGGVARGLDIAWRLRYVGA